VTRLARPADYHLWQRERQDAFFVGIMNDDARAIPAPAYVPAYTKVLKVLDGEELLRAEFPPRTLMLEPAASARLGFR